VTRQSVMTFSLGTCHSRANGTSASSPARRASDSQYEAPGIRVIAIASQHVYLCAPSHLRSCRTYFVDEG
jgi:hypothetical protein